MSNITNFAEKAPNLPFTEYDFYELYRETFEQSELGRIKRLLPFLKKYKKRLREEIKGFLDGAEKFVFKRSVGASNKKTFTFKVCASPRSFTYQFLKECIDPTLLDDLLKGDLKKQIAIINRVRQNNPANLEKLTATKANHLGYADGGEEDDFNTIMNEIFVKRSFEGENVVKALPLDKDVFVKKLG